MEDSQPLDGEPRADLRPVSVPSSDRASHPVFDRPLAGRYRVEAEIGRGGTSIVYRAHDLQRGGDVAIKVLRLELSETTAADRFASEVRRHQALRHPNILPVLDYGDERPLLFCVLPLMTGGTLRDRLQHERQLETAEAIAIARSIARALGHAHEQGVVHRDVKPENILFADGVPFLADFGIARVMELADGVASTTTGVVRGTGPYMSPEQAVGEKHVDGRTDVYSLGCVLYEMLTGMQPFVGPTAQAVIAQRMLYEPRPMSVYRPGLPPALEAVVDRALQITPSDRFQSANAMAEALEGNMDRAPRVLTPIESSPAGSLPTPAPFSEIPGSARGIRPWRWVGAVAVSVAIAGAVLSSRAPRTAASRAADGTLAGDPRRLAVLYLDNQSPDQLPAWVSDGLTEELIDRLGAVQGLRVISPNGVRPYRGRAIAPDSLGRLLDVGTIISGSVARSGDALRVSIRLSDASSNQLLYTLPTITTLWTSVFALQDSLADRVAFGLRQRLGEEIAVRENRRETSSVPAWELMQQAQDVVRSADEATKQRGAGQAARLYLRADSLLTRAEGLDPSWLRPTIRRGLVALGLSFGSSVSPPGIDPLQYAAWSVAQQHVAWGQRALAIANDVLRRAPRNPEALSLRGNAAFQLMSIGAADADSLAAQATRDLLAAVDLRPNMASAWSTLADLAKREGRFADAADAAQRAFNGDAFFEVRRTASTAFFMSLRAGRLVDARKWCQFGLAHYAGDPRFTECELTLLGWSGRSRADADSAWRVLRDIERRDTLGMLAPTWNYRRLMVAATLARASLTDSARAVLRNVLQRQQQDSTVRAVQLAEGYVRLLVGDRDGALRSIAAQLQRAPNERAEVAALEWFTPLHGDARFDALTARAAAGVPAPRAVP